MTRVKSTIWSIYVLLTILVVLIAVSTGGNYALMAVHEKAERAQERAEEARKDALH